ncbi:hypothetical protein [Edaphobacillus lindanitolerans]|uniref:Uncharacterized protein n=1 Tax=Edaphobacillus lindanitolerans TaxID=550447 RepID=A0A1U7PLU1_9BACI|nr:hypothetical protein [Edaphobacillus lindanitolerans]SIT82372.1 hypothetical protein SAMN05428946_1501 [Edaphobacillus lindanitolerans]
MEPIILLIISLIVGSLMKGNDKKKAPGKPGPVQTKPVPKPARKPEQPAGGLRELTRQLYEDLQQEVKKEMKEFREDPREERKTETEQKKRTEKPQLPKTAEPQRKKGREPSQRRSAVHADDLTADRPIDDPITLGEIGSSRLLPETRDDLVRGVIFSEILGPPKARRK